ncbi:retention module-containing protein, partial [Achromobacter sp. HZ01]|uniref:retention module-containing protein n=1 Tax=Achromobacter sp. HZ01 TaxID=1416886 RepID=UPI0011BFA033
MATPLLAVVNEITGRAWIRNSDGSLTELRQGSKVPIGSDIVTAAGATVTLQTGNGMPIVIGESRDVAMSPEIDSPLADISEAAIVPPVGRETERLLAALREGRDPFDQLDPAAAVLAGGGEGGGTSIVRLARILETTTPLDLAYPNPARANDALPRQPGAGAGAGDETGPPNSAPIALDDSASGSQDERIRGNLLANDSDPDGDPLTLASINGLPMGANGLTVPGSHGGAFAIRPDGSYEFDPRGDFKPLGAGQTAVSSISYTIADPSQATSTASLTVTVTGANDLPEVSDYTLTIAEDQPLSGTIVATDADQDTLSYTIGQPPEHGKVEVDLLTGTYTYVPNRDYNGPDQFTVLVDDGKGGKASSTVNITVTAVNDPPVIEGVDVTVDEDQPFKGKIVATDAEGDTLSYTVSEPPKNGDLTLDLVTGEYTYTPNPDYNGPDQFTVLVDDGNGGKTSSTVNIAITAVNDVPIVEGADLTVAEDQPFKGRIVATDPDGDTLRYTVAEDPKHGNVDLDPLTGTYVYTPSLDYNGPDQFTVLVDDEHGGKTTSTVNVIVTAVNDAPVVEGVDITIAEDEPIKGKIVATDVDGDTLRYTIGEPPKNGNLELDLTTGAYTYTPNPDYNGPDRFTVLVDDDHGGKTSSTVNITITAVNDAPVVEGANITIAEDEPIKGKIIASDADGDTLRYTIGESPKNGKLNLDLVTGEYTYTPNPDYNGPDRFTVLVDDDHGGKTTSTVNVTVTAVNDAPVVEGVDITIDEDQPIKGKVVATDADGDTLRYTIAEPTKNGSLELDLATGEYTYTPNP